MREGESRKYAIGKIIDFIRWIIVALSFCSFLRFVLELIGADQTIFLLSFFMNAPCFLHSYGLVQYWQKRVET